MSEIFNRNRNPKPRVPAIVGCTASGKSALAVELARRMDGEVVSCDSMQIYRYMDIGTAKPDATEMGGIPHHLIDLVDPTAGVDYSCADYVRDARAAVEDILARGKLPILCGGTGLYLDAFLRGGSFERFERTDTDLALRAELMAYAEREGSEALHEMLRKIDPEAAAATHPNNVKRVARAIEIYRTTGRTKSELDRASRTADGPYDACVVGLLYRDRSLLNARIDRRVDSMLEAGLLDETRRLRAAGVFETCRTAAQAIGYKELFPYLDGEATLPEVTERLKIATRQYAKRQMTWFSAKDYVRWVECDTSADASTGAGCVKSFEEIVNNVQKLFHNG